VSAADHVRGVAAARDEAVRSLPAARQAARDAVGGHPASQTLLQRFFAFLGRELSFALSAAGGGSGLLGYAILGGILVLLVWVVVRIVRGRGARGRVAPTPVAVSGPSFDRARSEARRLAASDAREALRVLYSGLLAEVGRRQGWRAIPGRSNWTFVRRLGPATSQGGALAECTRVFESRVYGTLAAGEADVRRVDELADLVLA
jgi:Domain of unknown function (DUF4129)